MTQFTVGQASIARIEETYLPVYRPRDIFPEYNDARPLDGAASL